MTNSVWKICHVCYHDSGDKDTVVTMMMTLATTSRTVLKVDHTMLI